MVLLLVVVSVVKRKVLERMLLLLLASGDNIKTEASVVKGVWKAADVTVS